jgi:hypothetical protein
MVVILLASLATGVTGAQASTLTPEITLTPVFTVSTTDNSGQGSLRQAIMDSNGATPGPNVISFTVSGTISPTTPLPPITTPVTIDGTSAPGFSGQPVVRIDGAGAGSGATGLEITAGQSELESLEVTGWSGPGVALKTNGSNLLTGNYIGTDGSSALPNHTGILASSSGNTIGTGLTGGGNLISGNSPLYGILLSGAAASSNVIAGNLIGTNAAGTAAQGNGLSGIFITGGATHNTIGGTSSSERNVLSGNGNDGVSIFGPGTSGNVVEGNYIGTDAAGTSALGNSTEGVGAFGGATGNRIGGTASGAANLISGNVHDGVGINGSGTNGNVVLGNRIGTTPAGSAKLANGGIGVAIFQGAAHNTVGGTTAAARNLISGNAADGVVLTDTGTNANVVQGNFIGTTASGKAKLANGFDGVYINVGAKNNHVGGSSAGARNLISGNPGDGVELHGSGVTGNVIAGNFIGTTAAGTGALGNGRNGVRIRLGADGNTVGGTAAGTGNRIFFNHLNGVQIDGSGTHGDSVERNSIFANATKKGIALTSGGNGNQAAGVISRLTRTSNSTTIFGAVPAGGYRIEVFINPVCADPEGRTFLGVTTASAGRWSLRLPARLATGQGLTATATRRSTSNTSPFSRCRRT